MGKASMCLKMLELLNTGQVYKCSELAILLETNSRNIIEYKKELEEAGYYITSIPGKYGGYQLEKTVLMPSLKLTEKEKNALAEGSIYLKKRNEFPVKDDYQLAISKIFSTISHKRLDDDFLIINRQSLALESDKLLTLYHTFLEAIKNRYVLKLDYFNPKNQVKTDMFHPYEFFMVDNMWYVIGWSENAADINYYKFSQIVNLENTRNKFSKWKYYLRSDYLDENGFKKQEWYSIEFKLNNEALFALKEFQYGKNLSINPVAKNKSLVKVLMQDKDEILKFVLSFGQQIEIIEPDWLKKDLLKLAKVILNKYEYD